MASTSVTVTITVDSAALTKTARTFIELAIAAAVEPAVKRELRKELAKLEAGETA
jgi:post-segregation antitoxin (ccd killing protein)